MRREKEEGRGGSDGGGGNKRGMKTTGRGTGEENRRNNTATINYDFLLRLKVSRG